MDYGHECHKHILVLLDHKNVSFLVVSCPFAVQCCEVLLCHLLSLEILVVGTDRSWNTEICFVMTYLTAYCRNIFLLLLTYWFNSLRHFVSDVEVYNDILKTLKFHICSCRYLELPFVANICCQVILSSFSEEK
jgi:hypothetical protein